MLFSPQKRSHKTLFGIRQIGSVTHQVYQEILLFSTLFEGFCTVLDENL